MLTSKRNRHVQREQKLVLSPIKRSEFLIDALRPVVSDIWTDIHFFYRLPVHLQSLRGLPVHAQRNLVIVRRGRDERNVPGETHSLVVEGGQYAIRREDTPPVSVGESFRAHPDG